MINKKILLLFLSIIFSQPLLASSHYPIIELDPKRIEAGKVLYQDNCASCHGVKLEGAKNWQTEKDPDGQNLAPPLNGTGHTWHHSDALLFNIIKYGIGKFVKDYKGKMMGVGDNLTNDEIDDILVYIKSYWKKDVFDYQIKLKN